MSAHVGAVVCIHCGEPLRMACPTHGFETEYVVEEIYAARRTRPPTTPEAVRPKSTNGGGGRCCKGCGVPIVHRGQHRPRTRCDACDPTFAARQAKQARYNADYLARQRGAE